ncbi:MAG: transposase [Clostridia bacterium]|nr:transposase [Clostridia bacterium]
MMKHKKRRRLKDFDYSSNGAYFITFCTFDKVNQFWTEDGFTNLQDITLSSFGKIMQTAIENIPSIYPNVSVDQYVIMPNHVHMILVLSDAQTSVPVIINQLKRNVTKQIGYSIFQRSYHDHIIRNQADYEKIWEYIEDNPRKWNEDTYYLK